MERLLFDRREVIHPAGLQGMVERTITVGSAAKELRMIGWRVGWSRLPAKRKMFGNVLPQRRALVR